MFSKMVSISKYIILFIFAILFIKSCGLSEQRATVSVEVGVKGNTISRGLEGFQINGISRGVLGTHSDIDKITVDVNDSDTGAKVVNSVDVAAGRSNFEINNLPLKKIVFTANAKNAGGTTIFKGRTEKIVDKTDSKIYINLYSIDDGNGTNIPIIRSITQDLGKIVITVGDNNATEINWSIAPINGADAITTATLRGDINIVNKDGAINLDYDQTKTPGKYEYSIRLNNNRGGSLQTTFTVFIEERTDKDGLFNISPVINNIIVKRVSETEISFEANATDDADISQLKYNWSATSESGNSLALGNSFGFYSRILTIKNFNSDIKGVLKVKVVDAGGLEYELDFNISAHDFDSSIELRLVSVDTSQFKGGGSIVATFNKNMYNYTDDNSTISVSDITDINRPDINGSSRRDSANNKVIIFTPRITAIPSIDSTHKFRLRISQSIKDTYSKTLATGIVRDF